jgi:hypothetical protein
MAVIADGVDGAGCPGAEGVHPSAGVGQGDRGHPMKRVAVEILGMGLGSLAFWVVLDWIRGK